MTKPRSPRPLVAVLVCTTALAFTEWRPRAAGTITGTVFEDFNGNGLRDTTTSIGNNGFGTVATAIDRGVAGVTVAAFDSSGAPRGTATTDATGAYALATTGTGPYRVEFTTLPPGYHPSKFAAGITGNGTTVQFVGDGDVGNINLGILDPANYCQNNPSFAVSCYVFGDQLGSAAPVIVDFPYSAGATSAGTLADHFKPETHAFMVPAAQVGTTYGLAIQPGGATLYAGAYMKKHSGFGPGGPGAIYAVTTAGVASVFAVVPNAGTDPHNPADYNVDNGNVTWDAVGKRSLGGLELSPDGAFLFAVNLFDRRVYKIPTAGGAATSAAVPVPASAVPATGADIRPFALQYYRGLLYVGMVNSAETTQAAANLRAYVYTLDPATLAFSAAPVFEMPLGFTRGFVQQFDGQSAGTWLPWRPTFATNTTGTVNRYGVYPQPMLSGLTFDVNGNMVLGFRDRAGDQFGFFTFDDPANPVQLWEGIAGGDVLLAQLNTQGDLSSGWTLEANAATPLFGPTAGAGNNQGPGGGEYFWQEFFTTGSLIFHEEQAMGAVLQLPGFPDAMTTSMNPGKSTNSGGIMWMSRQPGPTEGGNAKGYNLYQTPRPPDGTFSKANGLGELVAFCKAAPIEIGNRVWDDVDGDGVQDANEPGIDGLLVQLIGPGGDVLATVTTVNGGQYYFSSETIALLTPNTTGYKIRIAGGQGPLGTRRLTDPNTDATANGDSRDSDAGVAPGGFEIMFDTGAAGNNNHTYDFGFTLVPVPLLSLGDFVWYDTNNNGLFDAAEQPIAGVDVVLYRDNGNLTFDATTDTLIAAQTTDALGIYFFTGLAAGSYFVQIPQAEFTAGQTLFGYQNSSGQTVGDANNRDHGVPAPVAGQGIVSDRVTLTVGGEPDTPVDGDGTNSNRTIDFGFYKLSLGNFVWFDTNNNGVVNAGELPAAGRPVDLLNAGGTVVQSTTTDAAGLYGFTGLTPGDYRVRITPPTNFVSSTGTGNTYEPGPDPDNDIDNDDNGTNTGATITSAPITLTPGAEPTVNNANGETANPTVDFGLFQDQFLRLGNLVWRDTNNDGLVSPGEPGIDGVTVRLYNATGTVLLNTLQTAGGGFYLFTQLQPGDYVVEAVIPAGLTSSTGTAGAYEPAPDPDSDVDNDDNGTTQSGNVVVRSLPVTLAFSSEPTNDGDTDPNSNLTVDFGFFPPGPTGKVSLGNLVWWDGNRNGRFEVGEIPLADVTLRLIDSNGTTVRATTTTNVTGNYRFIDLDPGTYFVEVVAPVIGASTRPSTLDIASTPTPDNDIDNDDNGIGTSGTVFRSGSVALTVGGEPVDDGDTDPSSNLTVDFGFFDQETPPGLASMCLYQALPQAIPAGGTFEATFWVENYGPAPAENVIIEGMLPPGTSVVKTEAPGTVCTLRNGNPHCEWRGSTPVGVGRARQVTVTMQVAPSVPVGQPLQIWFMGELTNPNPGDPDLLECLETDGYPFVVDANTPTADLEVLARATSASESGPIIASQINQPVTLAFTVTNSGGIAASGDYLIRQLSTVAGFDFTNATWTQGAVNPTDIRQGLGIWQTGPISPGATARLLVTLVPRSSGALRLEINRFFGQPADRNALNDYATVVVDSFGPGGGRFVAAGNLDGVAGAEIVTGSGRGSGTGTGSVEASQLRVFSGAGVPIASFFPFQRTFNGGIRVASCDVNADGFSEIIVGQGPGGGRVQVLSLKGGSLDVLAGFDAFESGFTGGVNVACADVDNDGRGEVIVGPDGGREPDVRVFDVDVLLAVKVAEFKAYEATFGGGVRVAAAPFSGSSVVGRFQIATMPGPGRVGEVRVWSLGGGTAALVAGAAVAPSSGARVALGDADADGGLDLLVMPDGGVSSLIAIFSLSSGAVVFNAPAGAAGITSLDATVGLLAGGPGVPEVIVGRGPGQLPGILSFRVLPGGAIVPRLNFLAYEVP